jgi:hypothetical protein
MEEAEKWKSLEEQLEDMVIKLEKRLIFLEIIFEFDRREERRCILPD